MLLNNINETAVADWKLEIGMKDLAATFLPTNRPVEHINYCTQAKNAGQSLNLPALVEPRAKIARKKEIQAVSIIKC